jgi:hypothetical protein
MELWMCGSTMLTEFLATTKNQLKQLTKNAKIQKSRLRGILYESIDRLFTPSLLLRSNFEPLLVLFKNNFVIIEKTFLS